MKKCNFKSSQLCRLQSETHGVVSVVSTYSKCCGEDYCILYSIYKHLHNNHEYKSSSWKLEDRQHD